MHPDTLSGSYWGRRRKDDATASFLRRCGPTRPFALEFTGLITGRWEAVWSQFEIGLTGFTPLIYPFSKERKWDERKGVEIGCAIKIKEKRNSIFWFIQYFSPRKIILHYPVAKLHSHGDGEDTCVISCWTPKTVNCCLFKTSASSLLGSCCTAWSNKIDYLKHGWRDGWEDGVLIPKRIFYSTCGRRLLEGLSWEFSDWSGHFGSQFCTPPAGRGLDARLDDRQTTFGRVINCLRRRCNIYSSACVTRSYPS